MINDNLLGDRLNAVKQGKPVPQPVLQSQTMITPQPNQPTPVPLKQQLITRYLMMADTFAASFLYGFALKTIFSTDWNVLGVFAVGFLLNHVICIFPKFLFPKLFK